MIPRSIIKTFHNGLTFAYVSPCTASFKTICFIPGFRSDFITSKKADYVYNFAVQHKLGFLSWNHAQPEVSVVDWYKDSLEIMKKYGPTAGGGGDYIVVGASMGLWIALLVSREIELKGIVGIGGGVDFTERWLQEQVPKEHRFDAHYVWRKPSEYDDSGYYDIGVHFLLNSRPALLLSKSACAAKQKEFKCCNVQLIHGVNDQDVPVDLARQLCKYLSANGVEKVSCLEIEDGDHRLSKPQDLDHVGQKLQEMVL